MTLLGVVAAVVGHIVSGTAHRRVNVVETRRCGGERGANGGRGVGTGNGADTDRDQQQARRGAHQELQVSGAPDVYECLELTRHG